jgi:hypothetical protein
MPLNPSARQAIMMKLSAVAILLFFFGWSLQGQSLKFKSTVEDGASKSFSFEQSGIRGKFSGGHKELVLTLVNVGEEELVLHEDAMALVDITGRGAKLCHPEIKLGPGEKIKLNLSNCSGAPNNEGLFLLDLNYPNNTAYKEEAWFLKNKSFTLKIGQEKVGFLVE